MTELKDYYHAGFFDDQARSSLRSASAIVPIVMEQFRPRSVVDVGCGVGAWLRAFADHGADRVVGIDGDYVDRSKLLIPGDCFVPHDLEQSLPDVGRFDLAVSLEVAEHLSPSRAAGFVADLAKLAPVVLFSAAAPRQGGENHVNEQWPEYWEALFAPHGLAMVDAVRHRIWHDDRVDWWYRQNTFLFVSRPLMADHPELEPYRVDGKPDCMVLVSQRVMRSHLDHATSLRHLLRTLPKALVSAARRRVGR